MVRSAWPAALRTGSSAQSAQSSANSGTAAACFALPSCLTASARSRAFFTRRMAIRPGSCVRARSSSPSPAHSACERRRRFGKSAENRTDFLSVSSRLSKRLRPIDAPVLPHFFAELVINLTGLSASYCAGQHIERGLPEY